MLRHWFGKAVHGVGIILILITILFPLYWMIAASLKTADQLFSVPPVWFWHPTLSGYIDAIFDSGILTALKNSVIVTSCAIALGLAVGAPAAYGIARYSFVGRKQIWFWYVTNWMLVPVVILLPFYLTASSLNLINSPLVLILVYQVFVVPLIVWLLVDQFRSVPVVLEEAALLDGLNRFEIFWRVALPLVKPGIAVAAILAGIFAWNNLIFASVLTPSDEARTAPTIAMAYLGGYSVPWTKVMASATMICAPVIVGGIVVHKYIARGLTLGAVK
ncbi:carbohydrate ABC transporter permease [Salinisphaera sp. USBA-960]|uniref:carbohydrate ABC transporter permease n=1 Tax=Salinisphaera orenii TaxID=856731 RepID=UPI000DBE1680|nr:carbohydrate ABC transporter permease [Salifodinibacter halophilus]NNC26404.1 carbohydrate ABC transporter permease [Salifodinibacter halophilus]